jgi:hypothetical protein
MSEETPTVARRTDLDALRAGAMGLGIVLHATLSFFPSLWIVEDRRQNLGFGIVFSLLHGFRMPLFFVMSGYFSSMLLHTRGRAALVKHRFKRVFLPLLLGTATIVPLTSWISVVAMSSEAARPSSAPATTTEADIWAAARTGDLRGVERHLAGGVNVEDVDPERGGTPLLWAAATGQAELIDLLIRRGANVNAVDRDGATALHAAAFLGHEKAVEVLLQNGAIINASNHRGETPLDGALIDEGTTRYFASLLKLEVDGDALGRRKAAITDFLRQHGATAGRKPGLAQVLMQMQLFHHLWFLWFLWWLVLGLAALSAVGSRLPTFRLPAWLALSPARYFWLVPLTMIPQAMMEGVGASSSFGPDTSTGPLPIPHVLIYYAIFFGFGAIYYRHDDPSGDVRERWRLPLSIGLLIVFPLALALAHGQPGWLASGLGPRLSRFLSILLQAAYPWLMTFGLMGLFRRLRPVKSPRLRYLAHLPLIIAAQFLIRDWPLPTVAKFLLIVTAATIVLLSTYQFFVRYTWLGRFLNGPRTRQGEPTVAG